MEASPGAHEAWLALFLSRRAPVTPVLRLCTCLFCRVHGPPWWQVGARDWPSVLSHWLLDKSGNRVYLSGM